MCIRDRHKGVDNLLIDYALKYKCAIITTDYNLNKLATLQSIKVLNVNDLSLSLIHIYNIKKIFY